MLMRVLLSTLTALLFLAVSADVIRAQEKHPVRAFTFTPSQDKLDWRPFYNVELATVYKGANGYSVGLIRIPPDKEVFPYSLTSDEVIRVQSGTLYLAFSEVVCTAPGLIEYKAYGPGSFIVLPAGFTRYLLGGEKEAILEVTHVRKIVHRSSE